MRVSWRRCVSRRRMLDTTRPVRSRARDDSGLTDETVTERTRSLVVDVDPSPAVEMRRVVSAGSHQLRPCTSTRWIYLPVRLRAARGGWGAFRR